MRRTSLFKSGTYEFFFYLAAYYTYSCRGYRYYHIRYSQAQTHPTEKSWVARPQGTVDSASGDRSPRLLRKKIVKPLREIRRIYDECLFGRQLFRHGAFNLSMRFLIYEQAGIVVMKSKEFKFSEILSFSLKDDALNQTVTTVGTKDRPTNEMFKRAFVGSIIDGKMGALIGGALTTTTEMSHRATPQATITRFTSTPTICSNR